MGWQSLPEPSASIIVGLPCCENALHHACDQHPSTLNPEGSKADVADYCFPICFISAQISGRQVTL